MATAISWTTGTALMFLEFGVLACSAQGSRPRSRFYVRFSCAGVGMLAVALGLAFAIKFSALPQPALGLLWLVLLIAALAVPSVFCYDTFAPFGDSSNGDGDGGPGSDPPPPPSGPSSGGAPLPDAEQVRSRRRDHNRPSLRDLKRRRLPIEPNRPRSPVSPDRR
jgi:hypothetical protein